MQPYMYIFIFKYFVNVYAYILSLNETFPIFYTLILFLYSCYFFLVWLSIPVFIFFAIFFFKDCCPHEPLKSITLVVIFISFSFFIRFEHKDVNYRYLSAYCFWNKDPFHDRTVNEKKKAGPNQKKVLFTWRDQGLSSCSFILSLFPPLGDCMKNKILIQNSTWVTKLIEDIVEKEYHYICTLHLLVRITIISALSTGLLLLCRTF